jgi:hypothetical protein
MDQLGSKDSSHKLQVNCVINFYFRLYLILYTYAVRFNVTGNLNFFGKAFREKQGLSKKIHGVFPTTSNCTPPTSV